MTYALPIIDPATSFADYDLIVLNSSAGKDSQVMIDYMIELADAQDYPREKLVVVHADLGRVEWKGTKELALEQAEHYGLRFEVEHRTQGDLLDHIKERGKFPDKARRYCTSDHKRAQIGKVLTKLANEIRSADPVTFNRGYTTEIDEEGNKVRKQKGRPVKILSALGIRADESPDRSKMASFSHNKYHTGGFAKQVWNWFPIFNWTLEQVWDRIKASGVRHHYAYDLGMPRLSCVFCVFAPKKALMIAGRENPELLDKYVEVEAEIGHDFRHGFKIATIKEALENDDTELVGAEDIKNWSM